MTKVADLFRQETNDQVTLACNPGPAVKKMIEDGEVADVVVVEPDFVEELTSSGKVRVGDRPMIGRVGVGLANRSDSPAYDISTIEKFKGTLLGADMIVFNNVKSGKLCRGSCAAGHRRNAQTEDCAYAPTGHLQACIEG